MEFSNHNDLDLILKLEHHGKPIRVADCVRFAVKVWTQNRNNFLLFTPREVIKGEHRDRLVIPGYQMAALESGVVVYEYSYSLTDRHFKPFEGHPHDHTNRVVTDQYWKNANYNQVPSNPVNYQSLNYLRNLIEQEVADRENAIIDLKDYVDSGFFEKLDKEIADRTAKDEELKNLIDSNKEIADGCVDALLEKIDGEIKRSNEVDIQLFNAIKEAGENTGNIKDETDNKIADTNTALGEEIERAKAAERELTNNLTDEVSRAKTKENELDAKIDGEIARAKVVENALTDAVDAVRDKNDQIAADLAAEVSRSNQKDNEHTAAVNTEVTRATAAEKAITDRLDVIEGDKDVVGSLAHTLEDAKHYTDDTITAEVNRATTAEKALSDRLDVAETSLNDTADALVNLTNKDTEIVNALNAEVSRATTKEGELDAALAVVNGDKDTIGSIAHAVEDANHYTDDEIGKLKVSTATDLSDALKPYASKAEVDGRIEGIIGTAPAAFDTLGEIADRLGEDNDAITAINGVLSGKANAADVYTKAEVDAQHTTINTTVTALDGKVDAEVNRAKAAEKVNADNIKNHETRISSNTIDIQLNADAIADEVNRAKAAEADLTTKVNTVEAKANTNADAIATLETSINGAKTDINGLTNDLASEVSRATTKEGELESGVTANASKIADLTTRTTAVEGEVNTISTDLANLKTAMDVVNGDESVIGSIKHGVADSKHYTDDEIAKLKAKVEADVTGFATKTDVATVDGKVDALKTRVDNLDLSVDAYTKAEVDQMIADIDVTDQLTDYAKTAETTCIKDENGNIITEMVIDNSEADDTVEVYTKAQCDELFAKKGEVSGGGEVDLSGYATKAEVEAVKNTIPQIVNLTQAQYNALATKAPNTLYIVNG